MVNKAILIGNLGKDPEIKTTRNDKPFALLSVATSKRTKEGEEWVDKTTWHNVTVWKATSAEYLNNYAKKGTKVYVEGEIEHRKYEDKDGNERWSTSIVVSPFDGDIKILDSKGSSKKEDNFGGEEELDDEMPF